jgi:MoxR-like ATPase
MSNTVTEVKPSELVSCIDTMLQARVPSFLWGPPGVGKSQIVRQVAEDDNRKVIDIRAVQFDPVDLRGLPSINGDGLTHWSIPDFLPRADRDGERGVLFLDELNAAPPAVNAALYQLVLERALGNYTLPDGWDIIAAGNRETDRGVTSRMPTPLANRFAHFQVIVDLQDWCTWAHAAGVRVELIAFLRFRPELLHSFDPKSGEKAFPSPRSWEFVDRVLNANPPANVELATYASIVGQAAAIEFVGFLRQFASIQSIDGILLNPDSADVPKDPSQLYAIATALARRSDENNFSRVWTYAQRMPAEYTVLVMHDAVRRDRSLEKTRAFIDFGVKHTEAVL